MPKQNLTTKELIELLQEFDSTGKREVFLSLEGTPTPTYGSVVRIALTTGDTTNSTRIVLYGRARPDRKLGVKRARVVPVKPTIVTIQEPPTFPPHSTAG